MEREDINIMNTPNLLNKLLVNLKY